MTILRFRVLDVIYEFRLGTGSLHMRSIVMGEPRDTESSRLFAPCLREFSTIQVTSLGLCSSMAIAAL